jgi:predicted ABC-type ATPase
MVEDKVIFIIAGPNGAGKTTFANVFLPAEYETPLFVNADLIATGLAPFSPESEAIQAGKLMLRQIDKYVEEGKTFAIETTLAGRCYARKIPQWQQAGYAVHLIFLMLSSEEAALERVALRVSQGGHDIPSATVRRRLQKGLTNFHKLYKDIVDHWYLYSNMGVTPLLIDSGRRKHAEE